MSKGSKKPVVTKNNVVGEAIGQWVDGLSREEAMRLQDNMARMSARLDKAFADAFGKEKMEQLKAEVAADVDGTNGGQDDSTERK